MKRRLLTPGPVEVPAETLLELAKPVFHHRTKEFRDILAEVVEDLKYVFQTQNDVFVFTSSGTGAMEAAVGWGNPPEPAAIEAALVQHPDAAAVFTTLCETSTATVADIEAIGKVVGETKACLAVDGISAVGAIPMRTDQWGVDVLVVGSQKALLLPPGLAFIAVSAKAWERVEKVPSRGYYFDLRAMRKAAAKSDTPYTPANTLVAALRRSLERIREEGIETVWARHHRFAEAVRAAAGALGLKVFSSAPADAVTALVMPEGIDAEEVRKRLATTYGVMVAGGQEQLKGKIIRIGHIGHIGAGVAAAERVLLG